MDSDVPDSLESQLLGTSIPTWPDLMAQAPPPFLLTHGTADGVVIPTSSKLVHHDLVEAGVTSTPILFGGLGHGFGGEQQRWGEL